MTTRLVRLLDWIVTHRTGVMRVGGVVLGVLAIVDAMPGLVHKEHAHTAVERLPGFWAVFGFLGCVVLILASKAFGHAGIMKREDYYDE